MPKQFLDDILNVPRRTNAVPQNGDIWRDIATGKTLIHSNGTTYDLTSLAGGGASWDHELILASDVTGLTDNAYIDDFRVNPIAYGLYEVEFMFIIRDNTSASACRLYSGWNAGEAYPYFSASAIGFVGSGAGNEHKYFFSGEGYLCDQIDPNVGDKVQVVTRGLMWIHEESSYYGNDFRPQAILSSGSYDLVAGSYIRMRKVEDEVVGYVAP